MLFFIEKNGKKIIPRSIYIKILVFLGLIGLSSVALRPIQAVIGDAITSVRTNLIERLEVYTGMEIRYSSIRPAFLTSLNIRNLKFYKDENEVLSIPSARFNYSLRELLFRKKLVIHTIQIDRPVLRLDTDRDRGIFNHFKSLSNSGDSENKNEILGQIAEFLPDKANYRIWNGSFSLTGGKTLLQIDNVNVNLRGNKGDVLLDTKFGAEIRYTGLFDRTFIVNTGIGINGVYLADLREGKAEIALSSLTFSQRNVKKRQSSFFWPASVESNAPETLFTMIPVTAGFSYKDGAVSLTPVSENASAGYYIRYNTETRGILAEINCDGFIPGSLVNLPDYWKNAGLFNMAATGNLSVSYENGALDYSVYLQSGNLTRSKQEDAYLSDAFLIRAYGNNEYITVDDFCLNMSPDTAEAGFFQGIVDFSGGVGFTSFKPAGTVSVDRFSFTGKEYASGVFNLSTEGSDIRISGEEISIGSAKLNNLDMYLFPSQRDLAVTVSSLCEDGGSVYLDAILNRNPGHLEASLFLDSFSVFNITESIRPFADFVNIPFSGEVYTRGAFLDAELFFSSDFKNIVYNAPNITVRKDGIAGIFSLSGTDRHFTLNEGIFYLGENELLVSANANFSNPMDIDFSVNANYLDLSWNIKGDILDRTTLIIRDQNGLHAYGGVSNSGVISGFIEGVDFPLPANIRPMYTDFYITMRYNAADFWSVNVSHFKVRDLASHNGTVSLSFSGAADQDGASFRDISYNDNKGNLSGSADFIWNTGFSFPHFIASMSDGKNAGESYFLEGMFNNNRLDVNASVSGMRVDRFVKGSVPMTASADAKILWNSADSFNAQINLSSFYARMRTNAIQASVDVTLSNDELVAHNLRLDYSGLRTVFPVFRLSPREGSVSVGAEVQGIAGSRRLEGKVNLDANFDKIVSWTNIMRAYNSFNGTLRIENIQYGDLTKDSIAFLFSGNEGAISVSGGINDMLRLEMDKNGGFYVSLFDPLPIRGAFAGTYEKGHFDAYCNDYFIDLASLWKLTGNSKDFSIAGGYITGKMNLRGPVWNPEFSGTGRGTSLRLQVPEYVNEDIRPVPFDILAEGYEVTFGPVVAVSGKGSGYVNGWFRFDYWIPRNIGLDISIPRQNPIPYNTSIASFLANGDASGKLSLNVNLNDKLLEIKGDLFMNNTEMGISMDKINAVSDETDVEKIFNSMAEISITAGPMVEFFWPNINSPILRVSPEIGTVFKISYDSQAEQYSLVSDVRVRSGEIYYLDRYFYIRRGNLVFRENERQFNPIINARAEIRDRADSGPVTISMIIENQPLFSFVPRFESSPGLTQLEIYSILSQNPNIQGNDNVDMAQRFLLTSSTDLMAQFVAGSEVLSQLIFLRQFERRIRNFLNLDMLSIRTRFLQNAIASSGSTVFGQTPIDRMYRVGNYFDNTTVFIGKYVGQDMFVQGTLTMKYDENTHTFGGLRIEPDIGLELQSPFFNIRWGFFPYHPENWWVNDHSITLIWGKSF